MEPDISFGNWAIQITESDKNDPTPSTMMAKDGLMNLNFKHMITSIDNKNNSFEFFDETLTNKSTNR